MLRSLNLDSLENLQLKLILCFIVQWMHRSVQISVEMASIWVSLDSIWGSYPKEEMGTSTHLTEPVLDTHTQIVRIISETQADSLGRIKVHSQKGVWTLQGEWHHCPDWVVACGLEGSSRWWSKMLTGCSLVVKAKTGLIDQVKMQAAYFFLKFGDMYPI